MRPAGNEWVGCLVPLCLPTPLLLQINMKTTHHHRPPNKLFCCVSSSPHLNILLYIHMYHVIHICMLYVNLIFYQPVCTQRNGNFVICTNIINRCIYSSSSSKCNKLKLEIYFEFRNFANEHIWSTSDSSTRPSHDTEARIQYIQQ